MAGHPWSSLRTDLPKADKAHPPLHHLFPNVTSSSVVQLGLWPFIALKNIALHMPREKIDIFA